MADRISDVYDIPEYISNIPDYLARGFPKLTGGARTAFNSALLPLDIGADTLRALAHKVSGLEDPEAGNYTGERAAKLRASIADMLSGPQDVVSRGMEVADMGGDALRRSLIQGGAIPKETTRPGVTPSAPARAALPPNVWTGDEPAVTGGAFTAPRAAPARGPGRRAPVTVDGGTQGVVTGAAPDMAPGTTGGMPAAVVDGPSIAQMDRGGAFAQPADTGVRDLAAAYRERVDAAKRQAKGDLSPEQKSMLDTQLYLGLLAAGSKRNGMGFLGNFGTVGGEMAEKGRLQQDKNLERDRADVQSEMQRIATEIGLMDKTDDNARQARQLGITEAHYKAMSERDRERLAIEKQKAEREGWQLMPAAKKGGAATYVLFDRFTGRTKDTGIPVPQAAGAGDADDRKAARMRKGGLDEREIIDRLYPGKQDREQYMKVKVPTGQTDQLGVPVEKEVLYDLRTQQVVDPSTLIQRPGGAQKPASESEAHTAAKAAIKAGKDPVAVNARLKEWGYNPVK